MPESSVGTDLLEALEVLTQLVVQLVRQHLTEPTILDVLLTIEEPVRNLVLAGVGHHCDYPLHLHTNNRNLTLTKKIPTNTGLWILSTLKHNWGVLITKGSDTIMVTLHSCKQN